MKSYFPLFLFLLVMFFNAIAIAGLDLNDGGTYSIDDDTYSSSHVTLDDILPPPPLGTNLDVTGDASIAQIDSYNNSTVSFYNGSVFEIWSHGNSNVNMSDGTTWEIFAFDNSTVTVSGGTIRGYLSAYDNSTITLSGGTVGEYISVMQDGILYLDGKDFKVNGFPVGNGYELSKISRKARITGLLADGSFLDTEYRILNTGGYAGTGEIIIIPEPASIALLAFGGIIIRRKKWQG